MINPTSIALAVSEEQTQSTKMILVNILEATSKTITFPQTLYTAVNISVYFLTNE